MRQGVEVNTQKFINDFRLSDKSVTRNPFEKTESQHLYNSLEFSWFDSKDRSHPGLFYTPIKRLLDIIIAGLGLFLSLPLMALIALLIKFDSPGPIVFKHQRIGQNRRCNRNGNGHLQDRRNGNLKGKPINIYKFRTMKHGVERYAISPKNNSDPRLTRIGKFLRSMCLDEIPQFINVLEGDMSLVGPRPEMAFIVKNYSPLESLRLAVKPGITGLWQLYGSRNKRIHENLQYDLNYIRNRSFKLDIKIMFKTIGFIFGSKNV